MKDKVFLNTNILIYALTEPKAKNKEKDLRKRSISLKLLAKIFNEKDIIISVQILNELHFNMIRKFKLNDELVIKSIEENLFTIALVKDLTVETYTKASQIRKKYNISYWDSLVVASALESGCSTLYSEDMHNNLVIENSLTIINPFENI